MPFDSNKIKFHDDMDMFFAMKDKWNPNDPKYKHQHKFQSRLCNGILVGYGVAPGNDWAGTYPAIDLDEFVDKMLGDFTDPSVFQNAGVVVSHDTTTIKLETKGIGFRC